MPKTVTPIFLFSLPRSGSTLTLKVLSAHEKIASVSEPYLLLPFCYASKKEGVFAEYNHILSSRAINNIVENLPNKKQEYNQYLAEFSKNIYSALCLNEESYFLDKTPIYSFIIKDIYELFPDAKFIFLFRNPVQVFASVMTSLIDNKLMKLYRWDGQLIKGPKLLAEGYKMIGDKAIMLKYEDFVVDTASELKRLFNYLELDFDPTIIDTFIHEDLRGGMGDRIGVNTYQNISYKSLEKWKKVINTAYRKKILLNYYSNLDDIFFEVTQYDKTATLEEIRKLSVSYGLRNLRDMTDYLISHSVTKSKMHLITSPSYKWAKDMYVS